MGNILYKLIGLYEIALLVRIVLSWVPHNPYNQVVQFLYKITEPVLYPIRKMMGSYNIGIDLSPLVVLLIIMFLKQFLVSSLFELASRLR